MDPIGVPAHVWIVQKTGEHTVQPTASIETCLGSDPNRPVASFLKTSDVIGGYARWIRTIVMEDEKIVAVIAIQTVFGADPQETNPVLQDAQNAALG